MLIRIKELSMRESRTVSKECTAIKDILSRIEKIERFLNNVKEADFWRNDMLSEAVIRQIEVIGEASKRISDETRQKFQDFPWKNFAGMRDRVTHQYDRVDLEIVWETATHELPEYKPLLNSVLKSLTQELCFSSLWQNLTKQQQSALCNDNAFTAVSSYKGVDYLLQVVDNRLYCDKCTAIQKELTDNNLFGSTGKVLSTQEIEDLSFGRTVIVEQSEYKYNVQKRSIDTVPTKRKGLHR